MHEDEIDLRINRRTFLYGTAGALVQLTQPLGFARSLVPTQNQGVQIAPNHVAVFMSPDGNDRNPGTEEHPIRTFQAAQITVRTLKRNSAGAFSVYLRGGVYYLPEFVVFSGQDSGEQESPIQYLPYPGERVVLSGGTSLSLTWAPYRDGLYKAQVPPGTKSDQLFVNGERRILARYPNYDPNAKYLNGFSSDAIGLERTQRWANPKEGYIHALHQYLWGDMHFEITGKDERGNLIYDGGWQNNRPKPMHSQYRFVENIFEELDAPGEWFLDAAKNTLYFYPPPGLDINNARVEVVRLKHLIEFRGTPSAPVKVAELEWVHLATYRADIYGDEGTSAPQRLENLSRRCSLIRGRGRLCSARLLFRPDGWELHLPQQL